MTKTTITGKVVPGQSLGRKLGYPTINLDREQYVADKLDLELGVYGGIAKVQGKQYVAAIVIGPYDKQNLPLIEAYLLDFAGDLYDETVTLYIEKFISAFQVFKSEEELIEKIENDVKKIKELNLI